MSVHIHCGNTVNGKISKNMGIKFYQEEEY